MMAHARRFCACEYGINIYSNSSVTSLKAPLAPLVACKMRRGAQETPHHACCILSAPLKLVKFFAGGASLRRQQGRQQASAKAEELSGVITSLITPREQRRCPRQFSGSSPSKNCSFCCAAYRGGGQAACHRSLKLRRSLFSTPTLHQPPR
jgi:hypothetical protein